MQPARNSGKARIKRRIIRQGCPARRSEAMLRVRGWPARRRTSPHISGEFMTDTRLDVLTIGNAIVDVIADATDDFLRAEGLVKGSMRLIDAEEAERLYSHMGPAREVSGGCAGNTAAGIAALGGRAGFVGQVAPDQLGEFYRHDLTAAGVEFTTPPVDVGVPTARSMILVTPDGHRTMNTFLGAAQELTAKVLDEEQIRSSGILYLEGYLWDPDTPRHAMIRAIKVAREAG